MKKKKNILLITTFFYPQNRIPVLRVGQWAKYWSKLGYNVTVLTTKKYSFSGPFGLNVELPESIKIVEVGYIPNFLKNKLDKPVSKNRYKENVANTETRTSRIKRFVRTLRSYIGSLLDIHDLWIFSATKKGKELFEEEKFDIIISSYSPPAVHIVASKLKLKYPNTIWVADFRDLWAYNHLQSAKGIFGIYEKFKERKTIKNADILVTVSCPLSKELEQQYQNKKVVTVENGFDPEEFPDWKEKLRIVPKINDSIRITYAGTIYPDKRDPSPLFKACNELIEEGYIKREQIILDFYGNNTSELTHIIKKNNSNRFGIINLNGFVSRDEALKAQKESDVLLFLEWNDPSAIGVLTGKLFEYLVSGVPILGVGVDTNNVAGNLIETTKTGKAVLNSEDIKKILKSAFEKKYFDFYTPEIKEIEKYARDKQAKALIDLIQDK